MLLPVLIEALEGSGCTCYLRGISHCVHRHPGPEHGLSLRAWAGLLATFAPQDYGPPAPPAPARTLTRAERVQLLIDREARGERLFAEGDVIETEGPESASIGKRVRRRESAA